MELQYRLIGIRITKLVKTGSQDFVNETIISALENQNLPIGSYVYINL